MEAIKAKAVAAKTEKVLLADQMRGKAVTLEGCWVFSLRALTRLKATEKAPAALSAVGVLVNTDETGVPKPGTETLHPDFLVRKNSEDKVEALAYDRLYPLAAEPRVDKSKPAPTPAVDIWFKAGVVVMPRKTGEGIVLLLANDVEVLKGTVLQGPKIEVPKAAARNQESRLAAVSHWTV